MTSQVGILAWDIGGANIKVAFAQADSGVVTKLNTTSKYLPLWRVGKEAIQPVLTELREKACELEPVDFVAATMTAELSDVYASKKEGVNHILRCVEETHVGLPILVLCSDGSLQPISDARLRPMDVAAANWFATGWLASRFLKTCVAIDVGSTTTSIIPVVSGRVANRGKTDLEKLSNGELVYTGALRTNVAAILKRASLQGREFRVSSELFALSADVHLLLGNISEQDYTTETADGRSRSVRDACARLARVVCADDEMLTREEIYELARQTYDAQLQDICCGLEQVISDGGLSKETTPVVATGLGRTFLAERAAHLSGFKTILDLGGVTGLGSSAKFAPAVGLSLMALTHTSGRELKWTQLSK